MELSDSIRCLKLTRGYEFNNIMKKLTTLIALLATSGLCFAGSDNFYKYTNNNPDSKENALSAQDFTSILNTSRPKTWWHWLGGNVTKSGIEKDLAEMADKGLGGAQIFSVYLDTRIPGPHKTGLGDLKFASQEWFDTFNFVCKTASKHNLEIGIHNCDGWNLAGGPWMSVEQSMKKLVWTTQRLTGNGTEQVVQLQNPPAFHNYYEEVAVLAYPATKPAKLKMHTEDAFILHASTPETTFNEQHKNVLFDSRTDGGSLHVKHDGKDLTKFCGLTFEFNEPFTADKLYLQSITEGPNNMFLEISNDGVDFEKVTPISIHQRALIKFPVKTAKYWRVVRYMSPVQSEAALQGWIREYEMHLGEIEILAPEEVSISQTTIYDVVAKTAQARLGDFKDTDYDIDPTLVIDKSKILNLSDKMDSSGNLTWTVPAGDWIILRMGMSTNGTVTFPATPEGEGFEADKFDPIAMEHHFNSYIKKMIDAVGDLAGKTFTIVETDSWEAACQNWTKTFPEQFQKINGYDVMQYLPVFLGEAVGSVKETENFLRDLAKSYNQILSENYLGVLGRLIRENGLTYEAETVHYTIYKSPMIAFREADHPMPELWQKSRTPGTVDGVGPATFIEETSTANFYGKKIVSCESLTGEQGNYSETPWIMKGVQDTIMAAGANMTVFHCYTHQPDETYPGWQMNPYGTVVNRKLVCWPFYKVFFDYISRVQYPMQQGKERARVLHLYSDEIPCHKEYIGESIFKGITNRFVITEGDGFRNFTKIQDGKLICPGRLEFDFLVMPEKSSLEIGTLEKVKEFLQSGGKVSAQNLPKLKFNPTLRGSDADEATWQALYKELYGDGSKQKISVGKGTMLVGYTPTEALVEFDIAPEFTATLDNDAKSDDLRWFAREHNDGTVWFFVANRDPSNPKSGELKFNVTGKDVEIWHTETGKIEKVAAFVEENGFTKMPFSLKQMENFYVVFKDKKSDNNVVKAELNGVQILPSLNESVEIDNKKISKDFTILITASPTESRKITEAKRSGIMDWNQENWLLLPERFHTELGESEAVAGLSVGQNSIAVFEHGAGFITTGIVYDGEVPANSRIALVYENNMPRLYLNGNLVADTDVETSKNFHPSMGLGHFHGTAEGFKILPKVLSDAQIKEDAKTLGKTAADALTPSIVFNEKGKIQVEFFKNSILNLEKSDGTKITLKSNLAVREKVIKGPFTVKFDEKWGAPKEAQTFKELTSWTESHILGIKHYSGIATYTKEINLDKKDLPKNAKLYLSIDNVAEMGELSVNGKKVGIYWRPPYMLDITDFVKEGKNIISIKVGNTWINRCLYEATLPENERLTWFNNEEFFFPREDTEKRVEGYVWKHGAIASGLIGNMKIIYSELVSE